MQAITHSPNQRQLQASPRSSSTFWVLRRMIASTTQQSMQHLYLTPPMLHLMASSGPMRSLFPRMPSMASSPTRPLKTISPSPSPGTRSAALTRSTICLFNPLHLQTSLRSRSLSLASLQVTRCMTLPLMQRLSLTSQTRNWWA